MQSLEGKVAWITGAGTGIGQSGAIKLAEAGAQTIVSGRRKATLDHTAMLIGEAGGAAPVIEQLDIAEAEAVQGVVDRVAERFGKLDILVNSAGLNVVKRHWPDMTPESWRQVVGVDLDGAYYCSAAVLPMMREQKDGLVINVSSWAGKHVSFVTGPAYNAAKHGLVAMSASLNREEFLNGIRGCCICPAEVATPILDNRPVPVSEADRARMLQSEDLGETILFVARMPAHVCVNEILISPTYNRGYLGMLDVKPES